MNFTVCYPDRHSFNQVIKIKKLEDWAIEYIPLNATTGYWLAESPFYDNGFEIFKNLVNMFPVCSTNNDDQCLDANPFGTIHLPEWVAKDLINLIKQFYFKNFISSNKNNQVSEWGNLFRNDARPFKCFQIPHIDYLAGMIGNLWFTDHLPGTTGTEFYEYTGKMHGLLYDFQVDKAHPLFNEYQSTNYRLPEWENFTDADRWGFKKIGMAPCQEGKMTLYTANTPHCPYIEKSVKFRWSHTFAFYHDLQSLKDIL
jgi:hypothetical protein